VTAQTDKIKLARQLLEDRDTAACSATGNTHPIPNPEDIRLMHREAIEMYVGGMNLRKIARHLGVDHQTIENRKPSNLLSIPLLFTPIFPSKFTSFTPEFAPFTAGRRPPPGFCCSRVSFFIYCGRVRLQGKKLE
jgi:hypothetical protein